MKSTPGKRLRGGAQRVLKAEQDQNTPTHQDNEMIDHEDTPTERSVKKYDFNAPRYQDFNDMEQDEANNSAWFEEKIGSPQDPLQIPRNLLAEGKTPPLDELNHFKISKESFAHSMVLRKRSVKNLSLGNQSRTGGVQKKTVRKNPNKCGGMTIPKPFNLVTAAKRVIKESAKDPKSPFVPLAIKLQTFEKDIAERANPKSFKRVKQDAKLTQPISPMLSTRLRAQHSKAIIMTTEEKQDIEMKKIAPFKAKPLNKRILETKQEMVIQKAPITIPQSPAIQKPKPKPVAQVPSIKPLKANPVPDLSKVFVPNVEHRIVEPSNFVLPGDEIHKKKQIEIAEMKGKEQEEMAKKRDFKAKPAALSTVPFTVNHEIKVTEPAPFELNTDQRGVLHQQHFQEKLEREKEADAKAKTFHANPLPTAEPFIPARSSKPLTEIQSFPSHLDSRMEDRKAYEEDTKKRLAEEEEAKTIMDVENRIREEQELKVLRRNITHKAQPVKKFVGVQIKPSVKKLTEPKTPMFVRRSTRK